MPSSRWHSILSFSAFFWFFISGSTLAQTSTTSQKAGADILLLIDQSGSMIGSRSHPRANDPHGIRLDIIWDLVGRLMGGSWQGYSSGTPRHYRISVIEFGSRADLKIDWTTLSYDPVTDVNSQIRALVHSLKTKISLANRRDTHHKAAIELADGQFRKINWGRDRGTGRKVFLLLVTDGRWYSDLKEYANVSGLFNSKLYEGQLSRTIKHLKSRSADNGVRLNFLVIGVEDKMAGSGDWSATEPFWRRHATQVYSITSMDSLPLALLEEWNEISGVTGVQVRGNIEIPCYIGKLRITVQPTGPHSNFGILDPNGRPLALGRILVQQTQNFQVYEIVNPQPGIWRLQEPPTGYNAVREFYYQKITPLVPSIGLKEIPNYPFKPRWRVETLDGKPFQLESGCGDLQTRLLISDNTGNVYTVNMVLDPNELGVFEGKIHWQPPDTGSYAFKFFGTVPLSNGKRIKVFESSLDVRVSNKKPLIGTVSEPSELVTVLGKASPELRLKLESMNPVIQTPDIESITATPGSLLSVTAKQVGLDTTLSQTWMKGVPNSTPPEFTATIEIVYPDYWWSLITSPLRAADTLLIDFQVNSQSLNTDYIIYRIGNSSDDAFHQIFTYRESYWTAFPLLILLAYLALNLLLVLFDLCWCAVIKLEDFVQKRRIVLNYQPDEFTDPDKHFLKGYHRRRYGRVAWSRFEVVFTISTLLLNRLFSKVQVPFRELQEGELEIEGLKIWRLPFSRKANVRLYPAYEGDIPEDEITSDHEEPRLTKKEAEKISSRVYVLDVNRNVILAGGRAGEMGLTMR